MSGISKASPPQREVLPGSSQLSCRSVEPPCWKGDVGAAEPPALPGTGDQAHPLVSLVCPQPAVAVQMFQSVAALGAEAAGSGSGHGAGPPAAVARGPTGTTVDTVALGGPAGGGVGTTHAGPAGADLPKG